MVEKKKAKKRKEPGGVTSSPRRGEDDKQLKDKPSKQEYNVAKWMRHNVAVKRTKLMNHNVEYFTASKAVDKLLECRSEEFATRDHVVDFLQTLLVHKFFHRARKIPVPESELRGRKKKDKAPAKSTVTKDSKEAKDSAGKDGQTNAAESPEETSPTQKKPRKIRLEMHNDQRFVDGLDAYVWIYDPIPYHYWIIGTFLMLGAIGVCLFPLWPSSVRLGVYYLSVAAACFLIFIILLVIVRLLIFCLVWIASLGRHHVWILPNLTEDVGFLPSFYPLYQYEYKGGGGGGSESKARKKEKKKESDAEENEPEGDSSDGESSTSQRSSASTTGRDFEIVDKDVEDAYHEEAAAGKPHEE